jgi:hypothetical protein
MTIFISGTKERFHEKLDIFLTMAPSYTALTLAVNKLTDLRKD